MILILMSPFMIKVDKIVLLLDFLNNLKRRNTGEFPSHCSHELFSRFRPLSRNFQNFDKKSEFKIKKTSSQIIFQFWRKFCVENKNSWNLSEIRQKFCIEDQKASSETIFLFWRKNWNIPPKFRKSRKSVKIQIARRKKWFLKILFWSSIQIFLLNFQKKNSGHW